MDPRMQRNSRDEYNFGEQDGKKKPNLPGLYYHDQSGQFLETAGQRKEDGSATYFGATGKIQADAFVQLGAKPATEEMRRDYYAKQQEALQANAKKEVYDLSKRGPGRPSNT